MSLVDKHVGSARVDRAFFARGTRQVARSLLGTRLVSLIGGERTSGTIVECEAYVRGDSTSHARRGRTPRNVSMFAQPGTAYVYFTYGMHFCMNLVTEPEGIGTAVLIRAIVPEEGLDIMRSRRGATHVDRDLCRGPARLCVALGIDRLVDGIDLCAPASPVFLECGTLVPARSITRGARVGVVGDDLDVLAPLRYFVAGSTYVSGGPRALPRSR